jgi:hypothetical protein
MEWKKKVPLIASAVSAVRCLAKWYYFADDDLVSDTRRAVPAVCGDGQGRVPQAHAGNVVRARAHVPGGGRRDR